VRKNHNLHPAPRLELNRRESTFSEAGAPYPALLSDVLLSLRLYLCLCLSCLSLYGCPRPKEADVKEDLTKYMDQARLWTATEAQINNAIIAVRHDQFVHDDLTINTLKPIVGVTQGYVQQLEKYHPQAKPLQNVHQEYIEAWRAHHFAIAAIVDCVEKKDYVQLAKANTDLTEAQRSVSDALSDLARRDDRSPNICTLEVRGLYDSSHIYCADLGGQLVD